MSSSCWALRQYLKNSPFKDYLLILKTNDALVTTGDLVPINHHIDVLLEDFPLDYGPAVSVIHSKFDIMYLDEVEVIILSH
jgi:hypothetical protein